MKKFLFSLIILTTVSSTTFSQQGLKNTAFTPGEKLEYKLYFNWKFIWLTAGSATMTLTQEKYNGQDAYKCALVTRTSKKLDNYFRMRDTLLCYTTTNLIPLYYRKGAHEGKRYYVDELLYSYNNGCTVTMRELTAKGERHEKKQSSKNNIYDMLSIFLRARNFSTAGWKEGRTILFPIADGNGISTARLRYLGKEKVKAENGKKYKCLKLAYIETDDGEENEIVRFFVTDDSRHVPIRLDLFLKFGSAKAFLNSDI